MSKRCRFFEDCLAIWLKINVVIVLKSNGQDERSLASIQVWLPLSFQANFLTVTYSRRHRYDNLPPFRKSERSFGPGKRFCPAKC
jgi:hypothetical protein